MSWMGGPVVVQSLCNRRLDSIGPLVLDQAEQHRPGGCEDGRTTCHQYTDARGAAGHSLPGGEDHGSGIEKVHRDSRFQRRAPDGSVGMQRAGPENDIADAEGFDPDASVRPWVLDATDAVDMCRAECGGYAPHDPRDADRGEHTTFSRVLFSLCHFFLVSDVIHTPSIDAAGNRHNSRSAPRTRLEKTA